jgi:hypothetical protein
VRVRNSHSCPHTVRPDLQSHPSIGSGRETRLSDMLQFTHEAGSPTRGSVGRLIKNLLSRLRTPQSQSGDGIVPVSPYRAVSVVPSRASCTAAIAVRHTRFLLSEAPTLPLPMCTWPTSCSCRFEAYEDRRVRERRIPAREKEMSASRRERRQPGGRRSTDRKTTDS